jgi:hypothetical protein
LIVLVFRFTMMARLGIEPVAGAFVRLFVAEATR